MSDEWERAYESEVMWVDPLELIGQVGVNLDGPVMLADRQGVYAHSFKCMACRLEFIVFSWMASRHRSDNVYCPECGAQTPKLHWGAVLSDSTEFGRRDGGREIYQVFPFPGSSRLVDPPGSGPRDP